MQNPHLPMVTLHFLDRIVTNENRTERVATYLEDDFLINFANAGRLRESQHYFDRKGTVLC